MKRAEESNGTARAVLDHGSVNYTKTRKQLWIYFLAIDRQFIKIGRSAQERRERLKQHQRPSIGGHVPLIDELCEVKSSAHADETALKEAFKDLREHSDEVFRPADRLIEYIRWLRDEPFVSVPEDADDYRDSLPLLDSSLWMPRDERRKRHDPAVLPGLYQPFDLPPRVITIDDFYTDSSIVDAARAAMGSIDLDPATHAVANSVVRATRFFTAQTNGLAQQWGGNVWLNPPFSEWAEWAGKSLYEMRAGRVQQLCALAATRTLTAKYFSPFLEESDAICIFRGRIPFWGGRAGNSPDEGHAVLYFGGHAAEFADAFSALGVTRFKTGAA